MYGEKDTYYKPQENVYGLFLDKNGDFYADDFITDEALYKNNASLQEFYASNPKQFIATAKKYNLNLKTYSIANYLIFQELVAQNLSTEINQFQQKNNSNNLYILIHGFRKAFVKKSRSTTAMEDFSYLRNSIQAYSSAENQPRFLEVYWDGMYDSFIGEGSSTLIDFFKLFENEAQENATKTGYALRKIISEINKKEYTIITHSLGAQVGVSLLSNTYPKRLLNNNLQQLQTPSQAKINICLVAPAMAATPFINYYHRSTRINYQKKDNYFLSILFNENDLVLNKRMGFLGPGPKKYGDTSLGCNYNNEIGKLQDIFKLNFKNSSLKIYDTTVNRDHRIKNYVRTKNFENYIKSIK